MDRRVIGHNSIFKDDNRELDHDYQDTQSKNITNFWENNNKTI